MNGAYGSRVPTRRYSDDLYGADDGFVDRSVQYFSNDGFTAEPNLPVPSRAVADTGSTWKPSKRINVRFINGTREQRDIATRVAAEFERTANIHFRFMSAVDPHQDDVRISFDPSDGFWSYIGTQALQIPLHKPTMNLGFTRNNMSDEYMMMKARHEFGHLAGLVHEHQHPDGPQFKASRARDYFARRGIRHDFDHQVLNKHTGPQYLRREYDPDSVMHYEVPPHITKDGSAVGANAQLSRGDKKMLRELYPKNGQKSRAVDEKGLARQFETISIQDAGAPSSRTGFPDKTVYEQTIMLDGDAAGNGWDSGYQDGSTAYYTGTVMESPYDAFPDDGRQGHVEAEEDSSFEPRFVRRHTDEPAQRSPRSRRHGHKATW